MEHWDSIDKRREPSVQHSPEVLRSQRALELEKAVDAIRDLRRETLPELMAILERRKIENFVHFTRLENLQGILRFGLIPAATLERLVPPIPYIRTDKGRVDGIPEASCLSVTHPNHFMFKNKRADGRGWVVLGFSAAKLLRLPSIFMSTNAAAGGRKYRLTSSLKYMRSRATPLEFEWMFADDTWLAKLKIEANETADAQAEVMVLETIPPDMLTFIAPYQTSLPDLEPLFPMCPSHVEWLLEPSDRRKRLVSGRVDDAFWQSIKYGRPA
jgi:hypothetical protein